MAKKNRASGEGTVRTHKSGLKEARLLIPKELRPAFGGKTHLSFYARKETDAIAKRDEAKAKMLTGSPLAFDAEELTFGEFLTRWLVDSVKGLVAERTFDKHESHVRVHLIPSLGSVKLKKLNPAHLQSLYSRLHAEGLSGQTIKGVHGSANRALGQAVKWRLISSNPARDTDRPKVEKKEVEYLSQEEVAALFEAARGDRLEALFVVGVLSGLRVGLKWEDVDFDTQTLRIRRQLIRARSGVRLTPMTKTNSSRRAVSVKGRGGAEGRAMKTLRQHRSRQFEEKLRAGSLWEENGLVFSLKSGRPIDTTTATQRYLHPVLKRAGVKQVGFHALRHTFATLNLLNGTHVRVVQEALGHSTIAETMNRYSHVLPSMQEDAAERLDALF